MSNLHKLLHKTNFTQMDEINDIISNPCIHDLEKAIIISNIEDKKLQLEVLKRHVNYIPYVDLNIDELLYLKEKIDIFTPNQLKILLSNLSKNEYQKLIGSSPHIHKSLFLPLKLNEYYHFYYEYIDTLPQAIQTAATNEPYFWSYKQSKVASAFLVQEGLAHTISNLELPLTLVSIIRYNLWDMLTPEQINNYKESTFTFELIYSIDYIKPFIPKDFYGDKPILETLEDIKNIYGAFSNYKIIGFLMALDIDLNTKINLLFNPSLFNYKMVKLELHKYVYGTKDLNLYKELKPFMREKCDFVYQQNYKGVRNIFSNPLEFSTLNDFLLQNF